MTIELMTILAIVGGGSALMRTSGVRGWTLPAVGLVAGTSLLISIATLQAVMALPTAPVLTLTLTLAAPTGWWYWQRRQGHDVAVRPASAAIVVATIAVVVWALRAGNFANFHYDSYRYLQGAGLLAGNDLGFQPLQQFETRLLSTAAVHAPAYLGGEFYMRSITPLLGVATVALFVWLCSAGLSATLARTDVVAITIASTALLVTNNRFVFHSFYINGHLVVALLLLVIAGCSWLRVRGAAIPAHTLLVLQALAIPALIVTRPEGSLLAGLAVIPLVVSDTVPWRQRAMLVAVTGGAIFVWHGFLVLEYAQRGSDAPGSIVIMTALGAVTVAAIPVLGQPRIHVRLGHAPWLVEVGLWLALAVLAAHNPRVLYDSGVAAARNAALGATSWGASLVVLGLLTAGALVLTNAPHRVHLRFPLTTFIPLSAILAYLRGGAYRVHEADSLNRMLLHVVPLAVLFVASAATSHEWGFRRAETPIFGGHLPDPSRKGADRLGVSRADYDAL